jgi:uncharacterized coiled-coil DUF342 family protein
MDDQRLVEEKERGRRNVEALEAECEKLQAALDAANKRAEEVRNSADVVCAELRQRAEAAEKEHDELRELSRHDAADIATLGKTCDTLRGELKEVAEIVRPGSVSSPILAKILHKIEGIPGMEVK